MNKMKTFSKLLEEINKTKFIDYGKIEWFYKKRKITKKQKVELEKINYTNENS